MVLQVCQALWCQLQWREVEVLLTQRSAVVLREMTKSHESLSLDIYENSAANIQQCSGRQKSSFTNQAAPKFASPVQSCEIIATCTSLCLLMVIPQSVDVALLSSPASLIFSGHQWQEAVVGRAQRSWAFGKEVNLIAREGLSLGMELDGCQNAVESFMLQLVACGGHYVGSLDVETAVTLHGVVMLFKRTAD